MNASTNRVAARLAGCPDPGGVLYPQGEVPPPRVPRSPPNNPLPKVSHLSLPVAGISVRELAAHLGLPCFLLHGKLVGMGVFASAESPLEFATLVRLCALVGVSVTSAA